MDQHLSKCLQAHIFEDAKKMVEMREKGQRHEGVVDE
jgi:hypothetical protein